ncbi:MAG TPA: hypothetical protein DCS42_00615 [Nitrospiraceae bacterium]|nr:hypothetical protein [Nitrospiraceae bacterium]
MINISDVAADKIKEIMKVEGLPNHGLRIVAGGGGCCGGSQYEIMLDEKAGTGDTVIEKNGAKLYVDAKTAKALEGVELAFMSDERGEGFILNFPNWSGQAGSSCGCGSESSGGGCGSGTESSGGGCGSGSGHGHGSSGGCGCG